MGVTVPPLESVLLTKLKKRSHKTKYNRATWLLEGGTTYSMPE